MSQTWTFDAPTGTYKDNKLSARVFAAAVTDSKVLQFTPDVEGGMGKGVGESVTMTRVANLTHPTSAQLVENVKIPEDTFSISTTKITVAEFGRKVAWTSLSSDLSHFDLPQAIVDKLRDQMTLVMDTVGITAFTGCKVKAIPTGESALTWDTDGTASTAATVNLNYYHLEQIRDYMYSTLWVPPFEGDEYFCLASTKALRGIKQDPKFEVWNRYTNMDAKATGEVGKIEGIRFVEVGNTNTLSGSKGTGSVLGEAVVFGKDAVRMASVVTPEIRREQPADLGRSHAAGWYGVFQFGEVFPTANQGESRVVHVTSS